MDQFALQALNEYNSDTTTVRHGGQNGHNFWNMHSTQFIFVPAFQFPVVPSTKFYSYTATDCNGNTHSFEHKTSFAPLTPIWKDIPTGMVELKVVAHHRNMKDTYPVGLRTFFKADPFPGRADLPPAADSYKSCALKAYRYALENPSTLYWLEHGKPDPDYYHNVYPSKTISSVVRAMIAYAGLDPTVKDKALTTARRAADYLLSITYGEDHALAGVPPTYSFQGLNKEVVDGTAPAADGRQNQVMMIYPATAGSMYLLLEQATGEQKYLQAALTIAEHYAKTVLPNGSWYLLVDAKTGEQENTNCCNTFDILNFMNALYRRTEDARWQALERGYFAYLQKTLLENYNWEGQFEDISLSGGYVNLTHFPADNMISYIAANFPDDPEQIAVAKELMRFVEDQFVIWGEFAPWRAHWKEGDKWFSPAGVEQYFWYVPIDASGAKILTTFLDLYKVTGEELLLEKAKALGDSITRMQNPENGVIPTHWMKEDCATNLENFWINCHIYSAEALMQLAKITDEI